MESAEAKWLGDVPAVADVKTGPKLGKLSLNLTLHRGAVEIGLTVFAQSFGGFRSSG